MSTLRERVPDRNLWVVYLTTWVLSTAYGLALATTPIILHERHFAYAEIGELAAFFGLGIVSFAVPSGAIIRRFSAQRTLIVGIVGYAAMIGLFPFLTDYWHIAVCRFFDGAFSVAVWVSCETLLLLRASPSHRAFSTSLYAIATGLGYFVGGGIAWALLLALDTTAVFVVAACMAFASAAIPLFRLERDTALMHGAAHAEEARETGSAPGAPTGMAAWLALAWRIKTSSFATFCTGFFQAACVLFLPLYLQSEKHVAEADSTLVAPMSALGMLVISNVAGRIGDQRGHLLVLRGLALIGIVVLTAFTAIQSLPILLALVTIGGGSLASVPPLSLALQGAIAKPSEYARSNSIFNVFFAAGLLSGPLVAGHLSTTAGISSILWLFIGLWSVLVVLSLVFRADDPRAARALAQGQAALRVKSDPG